MQPYDTFTFTHGGADYIAEMHYDDSMGPPWVEHYGHGDVREIRPDYAGRFAKRPGEVIIHDDGRGPYRGTAWAYDFAGACKTARADGWNAEPYDVPGETPRQRAAKAARADMERMRAWLRDDWHWCGVVVRPAGACKCCGPSESLWGIESDAGDYLQDVACELADRMAHEAAKRVA